MEKQRRIVGLDIETSPIITREYRWDVKRNDHPPIKQEIVQDWQILSFAWQWDGEKKVHVLGQDDFKGYKPGVLDDRPLCAELWKVLDEAEGFLAHNGDRFDIRKINARLIIHGFKPYSPVRQIDTLKIANRVGAFTSNRLKGLAKDFQVAQKGDPGGFETWEGCMAGDKKAWKRMKKYNKQDIPPLLDIYHVLRPWDKSAIPMNVLTKRPNACPKCGVGRMYVARDAYKSTKTGLVYQYYRCADKNCGGMATERMAANKFEQRMRYV